MWSFLKTVMCFLCFAIAAAPLSGGSCIFAASLFLLPFSRQSPSSFFLTLITICDNKIAS